MVFCAHRAGWHHRPPEAQQVGDHHPGGAVPAVTTRDGSPSRQSRPRSPSPHHPQREMSGTSWRVIGCESAGCVGTIVDGHPRGKGDDVFVTRRKDP